ncbi:hypothetical protein ScPMuIL_003910 [Solemya velum]
MDKGVVDGIKLYLEPVLPILEDLRISVNHFCKHYEAWQLILGTFILTWWIISLKHFLFKEESLWIRLKKSFFKFVKCLPFIKGKIASEQDKISREIEESVLKADKGRSYVTELPKQGLSSADVLKECSSYLELAKINWKSGYASGTVYNGEEELTNLMSEAYRMFVWTNPLHHDVFPHIRKMEAEVTRMCCSMFNGGPTTCGSVTSGGTESILLACLAYRNRALENGIQFPEIVVPVTAHAAFDKAAWLFHMKITHIPIDPVSMKVNLRSMYRAINKNTCMLVGSAPQFPHGVVDPMEDIANLGKQYNIPVHVDCCLGGFIVPFMEKAGFSIPIADFRLEGVMSISADTHKYGFAPKGTSVVLYRNKNIRKYQYFTQPNWPGGIYASPTLAGSRSGAAIAGCWATLMYYGEEGYVDATKRIVTTCRYITEGLRKIPHIFVLGEPLLSVVAVGSNNFNILRLCDALSAKGWNLNPLQSPASIHLCVTLLHTHKGVADRFLADMDTCVAEIMKKPNAQAEGMSAIYGMSQSIPDKTLVSDIVGSFLDACYSTNVSFSNGSIETSK